MPRPVEMTVGRLRRSQNIDDSYFLDLYSRLMRAEQLSEAEYVDALRFAILFSRSSDEVVARLGYRIVLQYGQVTRDYEPLRAVAETRDLTPVVIAAQRLNPQLADVDSFARLIYDAHATNFITGEGEAAVARTRGQMELRSFNFRHDDAVVVAPTSYGKSEMLIDKLADRVVDASAVVVPTKALIAQTRATIVRDGRIRAARLRVITHPDAYIAGAPFVAVMTQERLLRLFADNTDLALDRLLIDEAHGLLVDDVRARDLSKVVLVARERNEDLGVTYYTPFLSDPYSLRHVNNVDLAIEAKTVNEHVKAEKIIHAPLGGQQELYDQFLNRTIALGAAVPEDEVEALVALAGHRTLVYLNRPREVQGLAGRLAEHLGPARLSDRAQVAIDAIADLISPDYELIDAIKAGVLFHHGKVPDLLRQYVEELFREDESPDGRYLVTNSALLEGVNTPADAMVVMSPHRGSAYLSRSAFRNLIGRVGRFKEVFAPSRTDLDLLQPSIALVPSSYARSNWNVLGFLDKVANLSKAVEDIVANPLLEGSDNLEGRLKELEYLENIEPGASGLTAPRVAVTDVGRLCFVHGVRDFDIFAEEIAIAGRLGSLTQPIGDVASIIDVVSRVFLASIPPDAANDLARVRDNDAAQRFYTSFLTWRTRNEPYKVMIARIIGYWDSLQSSLVFVGKTWGDRHYGESGPDLWVDMSTKSPAQKVNLAVVKIKEEQDFVDFRIMKYIEVLNSLGLVEEKLYLRLKYGTSDPYLICLMRNGVSPELARRIKEDFGEHVVVDLAASALTVRASLPSAMSELGENDVLVYEATTLVTHETLF